MRRSMSAQSWASTPPAPALIETSIGVVLLAGEHARQLKLLDRLGDRAVLPCASTNVGSSLASMARSSSTRQSARLWCRRSHSPTVFEGGLFFEDGLRLGLVVPEGRLGRHDLDFEQADAVFSTSKMPTEGVEAASEGLQ